MSLLQSPPPRPSIHTEPPRARRSRYPLVILLIISLLGTGALRQIAAGMRGGNAETGTVGSPLSRMNSFALALLLGGLRGPLVMVLWTSSESQKQDRDLEDFDTKVEWIRLLQPEFDTVHIFQIWNKAYNISVFKASLANKYLTILDALDYAASVDRDRPDDLNIVYAIGGVYFDKLGQSQEKAFYRDRVRAETQQHKSRQKLDRSDPAWRRLDLDPILDAAGNILPEYLKPTNVLLVDHDDPTLKYDGSALPFLVKYAPYPDGVPPIALGYNYYQRAALLQSVGKQKHAQLSDVVVDSRPALSLKFWNEDETERARRLEIEALAKPVPSERLDLEMPAAGMSLDQSLDSLQRKKIDHARSIYDLAERLAKDSLAAYNHHLLNYRSNIDTYRLHMDTLVAEEAMNAADRDYLSAVLAPDAATRTWLARQSAGEYLAGITAYELIVLHYYITDATAKTIYPHGYDRNNIEQLNPAAYPGIIEKFKRIALGPNGTGESKDDVLEYLQYLGRGATRLQQIK